MPDRVVIYVSDVRNITGLCDNAARILLRKIMESFGKKAPQCITIPEFCEYLGLDEFQTIISSREVIYVSDVRNLTGLSDSRARILLRKIMISLNKKKSQCITVKDFSEFLGIDEKIVRERMK